MLAVPGCWSEESPDWTLTVYYTAVEAYHRGPPTPVVGCLTLDCVDRDADLGTYPRGFVETVRVEGTGRTAGGRYLNWSYDVGYWLDHAPRDAYGQPLRPFEAAAADVGVLPAGAEFTILDCGRSPIDPAVCARLRQARWTVTDQFTPGFGGPRHLDLYLGEETGPDFTDSAWYCTLTAATLRITTG